MSNIDFIYTDIPLKNLEYTAEEILGGSRSRRVISLDGSPVLGIKFSELPRNKNSEKWNVPNIGLIRYLVVRGATFFEYSKDDPWKEEDKKSLEWLLNLIGNHLRGGAKEFYYAHLWVSSGSDEKKPKLKEIDLAKFKPSEKRFDFGHHTIWKFVDSSIKP